MTMYFESDYDKNLREQRVNNVVKDYGIWDRPKVGDVSVSNSYSESAILKLTKMVLNINESNTVDFDISGGIDNAVCIGNGYLAQMKDLAREIVGDDYVC